MVNKYIIISSKKPYKIAEFLHEVYGDKFQWQGEHLYLVSEEKVSQVRQNEISNFANKIQDYCMFID